MITTTSSANRNKKVVERFGFADHEIRILVDLFLSFLPGASGSGGMGSRGPLCFQNLKDFRKISAMLENSQT